MSPFMAHGCHFERVQNLFCMCVLLSFFKKKQESKSYVKNAKLRIRDQQIAL